MPNIKKHKGNQKFLPILSLILVLVIGLFGWIQYRAGGNDLTPSFLGMVASFCGILAGINFLVKKDLKKSFQTIFFSVPLVVYFYQSFFSNIYLTEINGVMINQPQPAVSAIFWLVVGVLATLIANRLRMKKRISSILICVVGVIVFLFGIYSLSDIAQGPVKLDSVVIAKRSLRFTSGGYSTRSFTREYSLYVLSGSSLIRFRVNKTVYDGIVEGGRVEIDYYPRTKQLESIRKVE